jgi:hypothetical protein
MNRYLEPLNVGPEISFPRRVGYLLCAVALMLINLVPVVALAGLSAAVDSIRFFPVGLAWIWGGRVNPENRGLI